MSSGRLVGFDLASQKPDIRLCSAEFKARNYSLTDGTGMLLRIDKDKIAALKKAVGYLTVIDLLIRPRMLSKRRTFGKGEMVLGSKKTQDVRAALAEQRQAAKQHLPVVRPFDPSGRF